MGLRRPAVGVTHYEHRQTALGTIVFTAAIATSVVFVAIAVEAALAVIAVPALFIGGMFSALRTRVDHTTVHVAFRYGFPRRAIPVNAIIAHGPVRNRWIYGWGVRLVPGGWMYNVWGLDAVAVTYTTPKGRQTTFRIGTDDPTGLDAAITAARSTAPDA